MLKKIFAFGAALIVGTSLALAAPITGKTSSVTIHAEDQVCNPEEFGNVVSNVLVWFLNGDVIDFEASEDEAEVKVFIDEWNLNQDATDYMITDQANGFVAFKTLPDRGFNPDEIGKWVFLFKDGCFIGNVFIPDALSVAVSSGALMNPRDNSSSFRPGQFIDEMLNGG